MKIDQHFFPTNMLDAKGKTKVLMSEIANKSTSMDPQHQVTTTGDAKGKGVDAKADLQTQRANTRFKR